MLVHFLNPSNHDRGLTSRLPPHAAQEAYCHPSDEMRRLTAHGEFSQVLNYHTISLEALYGEAELDGTANYQFPFSQFQELQADKKIAWRRLRWCGTTLIPIAHSRLKDRQTAGKKFGAFPTFFFF